MDNAPALDPIPVSEVVTVEPASFWVRGGAAVMDSIILALAVFLPVPGIPILVALAYKTIFISKGGQTPGKMAAGIRVIRADGEPVGVGRALGRAAAEYLSSATLGLGYLAAAFGEKRALHDYIGGTRVINLDGIGRGRRIAIGVLGVLGPLLLIGGVLAAVAIPSMSRLAERSGESVTKAGLGTLRAATALFYGDAEGVYPKTLDELMPKHLDGVPTAATKDHGKNTTVTIYGAEACSGEAIDAAKLKDTGGWGYVPDEKAPCYGRVFVDCSHVDSKGQRWAGY